MARKKIIHLNSKVSGNVPVVTGADGLQYGEIAIQYLKGEEAILTRNDQNEVVKMGANMEKYVPYDFDGLSITTKPDGAFRIPVNNVPQDIAKVVSATVGSMRLMDITVGTDVSGMIVQWNGTKPLPTATSETDMLFARWTIGTSIENYRLLAAFSLFPNAGIIGNTSSIQVVFECDYTTYSADIIYLNGTVNDALKVVQFATSNNTATINGTPTQGWNKQTTTFSPDSVLDMSSAENIVLATETTWGLDSPTISYPETNVLELGSFGSPTKILVPMNQRLLVKHPDNTEHTIAYTSDIVEPDLSPYINRSGDTMTGQLLLTSDPTSPLGAVTKQYVDDTITNIQETIEDGYVPYTEDGSVPAKTGGSFIGTNSLRENIVVGRVVESMEDSLNEIFFPAAGYKNMSGVITGPTEGGNYWSSTSGTAGTSYYLVITSTHSIPQATASSQFGMSIRLVRDSSTTTFTACPTGEAKVGDIFWAKSNLNQDGTFATSVTDYGGYFEFGQPSTLPTGWRIPTSTEYQALADSYTGVWTSQDGINGRYLGRAVYVNTQVDLSSPTIHTNIRSVDRPTVVNPAPVMKQDIQNPDLLPWNNNTEFKDPSPRGWRIPTQTELQALDAAGRGNWTTVNGVNGRYFGTGLQVFMSATGRRLTAGTETNQGTSGYYWSSTPSSGTNGYYLSFGIVAVGPAYTNPYGSGMAVRCVRDTTTTDYVPCPAGEVVIGNIAWAKSNLSGNQQFAQTPTDYGAFFQWGQNVALPSTGDIPPIVEQVAYLSDLPLVTRTNVTDKFTFSPAAPDAKVFLEEDGAGKPLIHIFVQDNSTTLFPLTITAAKGYGAYYDHTGRKAITAPGKDINTGSSGLYDISFNGETDLQQTVITVPPEIGNVDIHYFLGQTTDPKGYIEFEVDSTSGTFIVPFSQQAADNQQYSIRVYVNNELHGLATGTTSYNNGTGYQINGLTGNTAVIKLQPTVYTIGWGRSFGFYDNSTGANAAANKNKLLRILNDPDYAHLLSETSTGDYFRYYQYLNCSNLTQTVVENLPDTVTTIGSYFRSYQHYNCTNLTEIIPEDLPDTVTTIGSYFRSYQHYGCSGLTGSPAVEVLPSGVRSIGSYFRGYQYQGCTGLTGSPAVEVLPDVVTSIGSNFRNGQYDNCPNIRISGHTHDYRFTTLLNQNSGNYQYMFALITANVTVDDVPKYYTDNTNTTTAPVTDLTPSARKQYLTNRTGIPNYSTLNANWK